MHDRSGGLRGTCAVLLVALASLALGACGSSSGSGGNAATLLKQTFSGPHAVNSGNLTFTLTVIPAGSRTLSGPITLSFGGPFQSLGKGELPASNFNVSISALGKSGSIGILSTGETGYVTLAGTSYQLPAATFQKLESSFAQIAGSPGAASGSGAAAGSGSLSKLGIDPLRWLVNPAVVGSESVAGADTTHIRARVNVDALLGDINTFLHKASSLGVSGAGKIPSSISDTTRSRIASEVKRPSFDVWTGSSDKTVRKLAIKLTLPVSGRVSTLLGGLNSASLGVNILYAELNQPQSIRPPATVRPFSEFTAKLQSFLTAVQGATGSISGAASSASGATGSASQVQGYSECIQAAGQDVTKMQGCAKLLNK